jgi:GntR family transcriptional repressor for pyruvate dehydrogenase complex
MANSPRISINEDSKIKRITMPDQIFKKLKTSIMGREYKPGERLPSEAELAKAFGVNRITVRMAIQRLNSLGILETRIGDGTYVKTFNFTSHMDEVSDFYTTPEMLNNVRDFRKLLEIECAILAMDNATTEDFASIQQAIDDYEEKRIVFTKNPTDENLLDLSKVDLEIHRRICVASHNELFLLSFSAASKAILTYITNILGIRLKEVNQTGKKDLHSDLLDYIKNKKIRECKKVYMKIIDFLID